MKELRARRSADLEVDLEGPAGWDRGAAWDAERSLRSRSLNGNAAGSSARSR
jgi:hypothetical protein